MLCTSCSQCLCGCWSAGDKLGQKDVLENARPWMVLEAAVLVGWLWGQITMGQVLSAGTEPRAGLEVGREVSRGPKPECGGEVSGANALLGL